MFLRMSRHKIQRDLIKVIVLSDHLVMETTRQNTQLEHSLEPFLNRQIAETLSDFYSAFLHLSQVQC